MSGPPPTPTHIRLVKGNPGKQKINTDEALPDVAADVPPPPEYLSDAAAEIWIKTAKELYACGLLSNIDTPALAIYCNTFARWLWAEAELAKPPQMVYTMTSKAKDLTRDDYLKEGWTDEELIENGFMLEPWLNDPHLITTRSGYIQGSPFLTIANKCFDQLKAMLIEFGMTPAARSRVTAMPPKGEDGMDAFLQDRK